MPTAVTIFAAKYLVVVPPLVVAFVWLRSDSETRRLLFWRAAVVAAVSVLLAVAGGAVYHEERPFVLHHVLPLIPHPADNAFPSDHTLLSSACAFLVLPFRRWAFGANLALACVVGAARVACLLHSPLDIGASIVFGALANVAALAAIRARTVPDADAAAA